MMRYLLTYVKAFRRNESGVSAIEFAIAAPFLIIAMVVMADLTTGIMLKLELESAARVGSQYGLVVKPSDDDLDEVETAALNALPSTGTFLDFRSGATASVTLTCQCSGGGATTCTSSCPSPQFREAYLTVTLNRDWAPLIPYPGIALPINLSSDSVIRLQ